MKFKVGDRVIVIPFKMHGTIKSIRERQITVTPDDPKQLGAILEPKEKIKTNTSKNVSYPTHIVCEEHHLKLIGNTKSDPEWKKIWDSN